MLATKVTVASFAAATAAATGVLAATAPPPVAAAGSVANIPLNIIQTLANIPANQVAGAGKAADALEMSGNWWLYVPSNVLGFDHADIAKVNGFMSWLLPVPAIAQAVADPINVTLEANFPMTADCTGAPAPCADPTYWTDYFHVMPWTLIQGVSYGTVVNTIDPSIVMPWSNSTQRIDVFGVARTIWNTLTKDPEGFKALPSTDQIASTYTRLGKATFDSLNPFVDGTYCLPCQFVVKGAPGSLSRIPLFGNWYTMTDLGQQFTDDNWVNRPPGIPEAPDMDALSLWSKEGQERLWKDINTTFMQLAFGEADPIEVQQIWKTIEALATGIKVIPTQADITGSGSAIGKDFQSLIDSITSSITAPVAYVPRAEQSATPSLGSPSAGSALSRLGSPSAAEERTLPATTTGAPESARGSSDPRAVDATSPVPGVDAGPADAGVARTGDDVPYGSATTPERPTASTTSGSWGSLASILTGKGGGSSTSQSPGTGAGSDASSDASAGSKGTDPGAGGDKDTGTACGSGTDAGSDDGDAASTTVADSSAG